MPVMKISQEKAQKVYEAMVDLLHELWMLTSEQSGEEGDSFDESEIIQDLIQELGERGVDEESAERVLRSIALFRRKARDEA